MTMPGRAPEAVDPLVDQALTVSVMDPAAAYQKVIEHHLRTEKYRSGQNQD